MQALSRAALAAGALATYPVLVSQLVLAVNHLTAAVIRHPAVADGINAAIGGAFVIGVVSSGLSLGLAAGALMAALFFLAAIFVMKIALTAMLCVLLVSGALVIALWPLPQGDGLAKLWGAGLIAAVTIPVSWALVFSVVGLVASDSLVGDRLGPGLEAAVKPFVAVACLYLVYKTPGFLVAQARMVGVRLGGMPGMARGAPGEARLHRVAHGHAGLQRDRFRGLGAAAGRATRVGAGTAGGVARGAAAKAGPPVQAGAARGAVNLVAAAGGRGPAAGVVTAAVIGGSRAASGARRAATGTAAGGRAAADWWRRPTERDPASGPRAPRPWAAHPESVAATGGRAATGSLRAREGRVGRATRATACADGRSARENPSEPASSTASAGRRPGRSPAVGGRGAACRARVARTAAVNRSAVTERTWARRRRLGAA